MPSTSSLMPRSLFASALALALCSCASTPALIHPPLADLKPTAEPVIPAEALTSAAALDAFDIAHEAWGRGEHAKVVRLCRWYRDMGIKQAICE